ncbi:hypothetical protein DV735_g5409, partial [Chaetothyriales sp. CBS 134920]
MAAASDKARFFLEQSVPELREFERLKLFSAAEISAIARKRSDFEHKINARGSTPADYARYAEFEMNVEALRKKRVKRLGIKANSTSHCGQRRIFFVLDRGTRKHAGDLGLWMQSVEYARRQQAYKKVTQLLADMLRLHPSKPALWIYAAQFAFEDQADMTEARGYMQRGLRFCANKKELWLQYCRLELSYLAKIEARRRILGVAQDDPKASTADDTGDQSPTSQGAIPIAIFDAAMAQFNGDAELAHGFVETLADFSDVPASRQVLRHIRNHLLAKHPSHWATSACSVREAVFGLPVSSPEFPGALRESLKRLKTTRAERAEEAGLVEWARKWLDSLLTSEEDVDPAIETVVKATARTLPQLAEEPGPRETLQETPSDER